MLLAHLPVGKSGLLRVHLQEVSVPQTDLKQPVICRTDQISVLLPALTYTAPFATKRGGQIDIFMVISLLSLG